jgi:hypothetical protein
MGCVEAWPRRAWRRGSYFRHLTTKVVERSLRPLLHSKSLLCRRVMSGGYLREVEALLVESAAVKRFNKHLIRRIGLKNFAD